MDSLLLTGSNFYNISRHRWLGIAIEMTTLPWDEVQIDYGVQERHCKSGTSSLLKSVRFYTIFRMNKKVAFSLEALQCFMIPGNVCLWPHRTVVPSYFLKTFFPDRLFVCIRKSKVGPHFFISSKFSLPPFREGINSSRNVCGPARNFCLHQILPLKSLLRFMRTKSFMVCLRINLMFFREAKKCPSFSSWKIVPPSSSYSREISTFRSNGLARLLHFQVICRFEDNADGNNFDCGLGTAVDI